MIGFLAKYEAGSQVFLRVTNFKSLRQGGAYLFEIAFQKVLQLNFLVRGHVLCVFQEA